MNRPRLRWSAGLATVGLLVSGYLAAAHYFADQVPLACSTGGIVDCEQVTNSGESMIGPLPVATIGLAWFFVLLVLILIRREAAASKLMVAQVAWSVGGLLFVFYLVYAELFLIGAICLWCTLIHAIVVALFLSSLYEATAVAPT